MSEIDLVSKLLSGLNKLDNKMIMRRLERERNKLDTLFRDVENTQTAAELGSLLEAKSQNWVLEVRLPQTCFLL